jgi:branched-chain amino acid transport system ATP-binding protein
MTVLLRVGGLSAGYGQVEVLHKIDLDVQEGEVSVILGANGAGKTTTMRAISGMIPRKGDIEFAGKSILKSSPEAIVRLGIAQVPQGRGTFTDLTVDDNLRAGAYVRRDRDVENDLALWYDTFPRLRDRHSQKAGTLSGGEQQMLAMARAVATKPALLLLDELSMGLAPIVVEDLYKRVADIARSGISILVVEQFARTVLGVADLAAIMVQGRISTVGSPAKVAEQLTSAYLGGSP